MNFHPTPPDSYRWVFRARWWDCVREGLDMSMGENLTGLPDQEWSYVDLYETEDTCIAPTAQAAANHFQRLYPWIENFHITLLGEHRPTPPKSKRKRNPQRLNP